VATELFTCECGQVNRVPADAIHTAAARGPRGAVTAPGIGYRCGACKREFTGEDVARWLADKLGWDPMNNAPTRRTP
jgi:hypothetical protein